MKIFAPISKSGINYSVDDKNDKDAMVDATVTIGMSWEWNEIRRQQQWRVNGCMSEQG